MKQADTRYADDTDYKSIAESIIELTTDFPFTSPEIQESIKEQGIERYLQRYAPELAEIAELLIHLGELVETG